jgi:hypothetical protein
MTLWPSCVVGRAATPSHNQYHCFRGLFLLDQRRCLAHQRQASGPKKVRTFGALVRPLLAQDMRIHMGLARIGVTTDQVCAGNFVRCGPGKTCGPTDEREVITTPLFSPSESPSAHAAASVKIRRCRRTRGFGPKMVVVGGSAWPN